MQVKVHQPFASTFALVEALRAAMSGAAGDEAHDVTTASVLRRDVPWETYLTARLLSEPDCASSAAMTSAARPSRKSCWQR